MGLVVLAACATAIVVIVQGVLKIPIEGSVLVFLLGALLHLFATTSLGIFLATLARSMPQFGLLLMLVLIPLQLLSGGVTPRESMPGFVLLIMQAAPTTHFVKLAQAVLYRGAGFEVVWPQLLALTAIGAIFFAVALARFRRAIGSMA
jgi:ABC-2 type transport system permease protein